MGTCRLAASLAAAVAALACVTSAFARTPALRPAATRHAVGTMQPAYRAVTVQQLLWHTSGMPYQPRTPESTTDGRARDAVGRRYEYVKAAGVVKPEAAPGTKNICSGGQSALHWVWDRCRWHLSW